MPHSRTPRPPMLLPRLPPPHTTLRRRPLDPIPARRPDLPVQPRHALPTPPPPETNNRMAPRTHLARRHHLDNTNRPLDNHIPRRPRVTSDGFIAVEMLYRHA